MSKNNSSSNSTDLENLLTSALDDFSNPDEIKDIKPLEEKLNFSEAEAPKKIEEDEFVDIIKNMLSSDQTLFDQNFFENLKKSYEDSKDIPDEASFLDEMNKIWSESNASNFFPAFSNNIMQKIMAKNILYPSLKDLSLKYPDWLKEKKPTLKKEDFNRYNNQFELIKKVCKLYEQHTDDDSPIKEEIFKEIVEHLHEMQKCGSPPKDLIGDAPNLNNPIQQSSIDEINQFLHKSKDLDQCNQM